MNTISISLQKGGTGKTSLAVSLAAEFAKTGNTVLVDADPQGNSSAWIGPELLDYELADILNAAKDKQGELLKKAIIKTTVSGLFILPTIGLGGSLKAFENTARDKPGCFRGIVSLLESMNFQFCVIDLSPSFGPIEKAALIASKECVTPVMPDAFGLDGLTIFSNNLKELRETCGDLGLSAPDYRRIVINAIDNRIAQHGEVLSKMKEVNTAFNLYCLPVDPIFRKCQAAGLAIQELQGAKKETIQELSRLAMDIQKGA